MWQYLKGTSNFFNEELPQQGENTDYMDEYFENSSFPNSAMILTVT